MNYSIRSECYTFVNIYGKRIINMINEETDHKQVCQSLKLAVYFKETEEISNEETSSEQSIVECEICKIIMEHVEKEIQGANKTKINTALHRACKHAPRFLRHECNKFVDKYGERVIDMLVNRIDPKKVCKELQLCLALNTNRSEETNPGYDTAIEKSKGGCKICKVVLKLIEKEIKDKNEKEIEHLVHHICKNIPKIIRHECDKFVHKYADRVVDMLVNKLDPKEVCHKLKLCNVAAIDVVQEIYIMSEVPLQLDTSKGGCKICKIVMKEVEKNVKGKTQDEIKHLVHGICKNIPKLVRHECDKFVDKYADRVVDMLVNKLDPKEVCHKLKLCNVAAIDVVQDTYELRVSDIPIQTEHSKSACKICKIVMKEIEKNIKGKNEEEIKNLVHGICKNTPKFVRHECDKFVDKYADRVIDMLVNKLDPEQVCHKLQLCQMPSRAQWVKVSGDTGDISTALN